MDFGLEFVSRGTESKPRGMDLTVDPRDRPPSRPAPATTSLSDFEVDEISRSMGTVWELQLKLCGTLEVWNPKIRGQIFNCKNTGRTL